MTEKKWRYRNGEIPLWVKEDKFGMVSRTQSSAIRMHYPDGRFILGEEHAYDLIEVGPYDDFKVDDPCMFSMDGECWHRRHFAGVGSLGLPMSFTCGKTSWTTDTKDSWNHCRRPTEEELK